MCRSRDVRLTLQYTGSAQVDGVYHRHAIRTGTKLCFPLEALSDAEPRVKRVKPETGAI